jgi:hypothetical protein
VPTAADHQQDAKAVRVRRADNVEGEFVTVTFGVLDPGGTREGWMEIPPHTTANECDAQHYGQKTPENDANYAT